MEGRTGLGIASVARLVWLEIVNQIRKFIPFLLYSFISNRVIMLEELNVIVF
jgi:hypothetical protein